MQKKSYEDKNMTQELTTVDSQQMMLQESMQGTETENQYLTFQLGDEIYGIEILKVQEIKGWEGATPLPNSPDYIRGIMNLRGAIVPILDLRRRFSMPEVAFTAYTVVVVVHVCGRTIGMIVDSVSDVVNFQSEDVRNAPDFGASIDTAFIQGLIPLDEEMIILLNIDEMLKNSELLRIDELTE